MPGDDWLIHQWWFWVALFLAIVAAVAADDRWGAQWDARARCAAAATRGSSGAMTDDWMTDEHKAAALEGWLGNPVAQAYAARPATVKRTGPTEWVWSGTANGITLLWRTTDPLLRVYVRPTVKDGLLGVELLDDEGETLACAVNRD